jgi:FkbM family methyltransferase
MANLGPIYRALRPFVRRYTDVKRLKKINYEVQIRFGMGKFDLDGKVVIDLGANRGDFTMWAAGLGARVISLEPDPLAFHYLAKRVLNESRVYILNCAANNQTNFSNLYHHRNRGKDPLGHSISSSLNSNKANVSNTEYSQVLAIDLTAILSVDSIKLIKIDIEGGEINIWPTIKSHFSNIEFMLMEIHEAAGLDFKIEVETFIKTNSLQDKWKIDWV